MQTARHRPFFFPFLRSELIPNAFLSDPFFRLCFGLRFCAPEIKRGLALGAKLVFHSTPKTRRLLHVWAAESN